MSEIKTTKITEMTKNGDSVKREYTEVELKIIVNGITSRRSIKKVSEDNKIPMNDVYVRINFSLKGKKNTAYTASQRLSSLGNLYLELEQEVNKPANEKKVYTVSLKSYKGDENNPFINFLSEVSDDEFKKALIKTQNQSTFKKGNIAALMKR